VDSGEVLRGPGDGGVVGSVGGLADGEGALGVGQGLGRLAEVAEDRGEVAQVGGDFGVVGSVSGLVDGDGALYEGSGADWPRLRRIAARLLRQVATEG
jgi:hypothetical protein